MSLFIQKYPILLSFVDLPLVVHARVSALRLTKTTSALLRSSPGVWSVPQRSCRDWHRCAPLWTSGCCAPTRRDQSLRSYQFVCAAREVFWASVNVDNFDFGTKTELDTMASSYWLYSHNNLPFWRIGQVTRENGYNECSNYVQTSITIFYLFFIFTIIIYLSCRFWKYIFRKHQ